MDSSEDLDLLEVQSRAWRDGANLSLEALIEQYAELNHNAELLLDLIYNEILLREERGERPQTSDYEQRFPHLARQLQRQWEIHCAIGSSSAPRALAVSSAPEQIFAGRYETTRFHQEGGLGFVYLAHDRQLNRAVALKCMKRAGRPSDPLVMRFLHEAEITSHLEHPSIAPIHDSGVTEDGRPFYAMRFVEGQTFEAACKLLHAQPTTVQYQGEEFRRLLRALTQVCQAVAYAHSKQILHRDLKPANIMLGKYGEAVVLDWGLAKRIGQPDDVTSQGQFEVDTVIESFSSEDTPSADLTITGRAKGSPAFMSPEQARGDWRQVGFASDVYSLGATLYYLLTGKLAFSATTSQGVLKQVGAGEFRSPQSFDIRAPAALSAVTCKAMALRPADRYATPLEFAKELDRWMADEPVTAYRDSLAVRTARWVRRNRTLVTTCMVGLIIASLALAVGAWRAHLANVALSQANEKESQQRLLANQRFSEALDDQVRLVTEVQAELSKAAGTRNIRERLVKEAMTKLQRLIGNAGDVNDAEIALISAHLALGALYEEVDLDLGKAEAEIAIAASLAEALQKKQNSIDVARELRFDCLLKQFDILAARGKIPDAKEKLLTAEDQLPHERGKRDLALARWRSAWGRLGRTQGAYSAAVIDFEQACRYWSQQEDSTTRTLQLSLVYSELGELKQALGQFGESVANLVLALELQRKLMAHDPMNILYQLRAAEICADLGFAEMARTRHIEAEKYLADSIRLSQTISATDPDNNAAKLQHANAQFAMAGLAEDRGKLAQSLQLISEARTIAQTLVNHDDRSIEGRSKLAHYLVCEGRIRQTQGKHKEAKAAFDESAKLQRELLRLVPQRAQAYVDLADVLRDLAELKLSSLQDDPAGFQAFAEAQVELERLAQIDPNNVRWQSLRIGNLMDIVRWKQIRQLPGVQDAVAASRREIAELPKFMQESPPMLNQIAFLQRILAESFITQKRYDDAGRVLKDELAILEDLKAKMPQEAFVWRHLRTLYGQLATVYEAQNTPSNALDALRNSVQAGRELEHRFPDYDRQNQYLPEKLEQLADRLVFTQPLEALRLLEEAITRYDEIVPEVAARFQFQLNLGVKRLKVADLSALTAGDEEATINRYLSASEHFAHCLSDDPQQQAVAKSFQLWSLCSYCEQLLLAGQFEQAKKVDEQLKQEFAAADMMTLVAKLPVGQHALDWRNDYRDLVHQFPAVAQSHAVIEGLPQAQRLLALQVRVAMLIGKNDLAEAARSIDWLAENAGETASISYKAARMYGTLFTQSNPENLHYRDRALELLSTAIEQGFFDEPGNKPLARLAPEFRSFSESPQFNRLFESQ